MRQHVRRHIADTDVGQSVEFASLLDPIRTRPDAADVVHAPEAIEVPDPLPEGEVDRVIEPAVEVVAVSRFADIGIDDDRLPMHAAAKRFRLR